MYGDRRGGGFRPQGRFGGGGGGFGGDGGFAPVKVGEEIDVKIEAVGEKGDGIARKSGFVLFVPNTREGDEVRIRVTKVLRKVGFAEVVGEAQGPLESETKEEKAPEETESFGEPEQPAPEPNLEDTEDFGEEPAPAAEAPEEPSSEEVGEEPAPAAEAPEEPFSEEVSGEDVPPEVSEPEELGEEKKEE